MNIHEYQAKELFRTYGLALPPARSFDARSLSVESIREISPGPYAVKAQIHAGGRGKAGGIRIVSSARDAFDAAKKMLGTKLATYQTAGIAKPIQHVLIESSSQIRKELYLAITLDREAGRPCVICSESGGVEIEEVARTSPDKILKQHFDLKPLPTAADFRRLTSRLFEGEGSQAGRLRNELADMSVKLARLTVELDASLVEVNPLGLMTGGSLMPVDAKINFDDNALFRHPEIASLRDPEQEDARENEAKSFDLSYVGLEGNIGCMVNGAGLAMATMDMIKLVGGEPANFLDVGGGATQEKVTAAFKIILQDPRVKVIFVNIFGGIVHCDVIAEGILAAVKEMALSVPLIVRLEGTNAKEGKNVLASSGLSVISADGFLEGAKKSVQAIH